MWILREISGRGGEVGFRSFMELALYHPGHGYYASGRMPWGRDGDYLTAPTASDWYGVTVAGLLRETSMRFGGRLHLVDVAAGDGSFLASVLAALGGRAAGVLAAVTAVERSAVLRDRIADRLGGLPVAVRITDGFEGGGAEPVVIHASELYDAMPVHLVEQTAGGLLELTVVARDGGLHWGRRQAGADLETYFHHHGVELEVGQLAEINPAAETAHRELLKTGGDGVALILDYGYEAGRLYDPRGRRFGSLVSYRGHEVGRELLDSPGERDLTAHINWDDLRQAATSCGWAEIGLMPLAEFLVRSGIAERVDEAGFGIDADLDATTVTARQEIKRLLDPEGMGSDLKMLIQGKGELGEIAAEILTRPV
jgi:SAM-dependent MidA family methyltransferase